MIAFYLLIVICATIYFFGWYSLPEKIDPSDYQEQPNPREILKGAEPFDYKGDSDTGFLLLHGYESSPYTLKALGKFLNAQGHSVHAPLFPGHGTTLSSFEKTRYEHWYECARRAYIQGRGRYKHFFVIGFSLGGNIALRLAAQYQKQAPPSALVLISAPVTLNGILNGKLFFRDWRMIFTGIARYFLGPISKKRDLVSMDIINPTVSYTEAYVVSPLHSLRTNLVKVKKVLHQIKTPLCVIHASNDKTIHIENTHYIMRKISSVEKRAHIFRIDENISTRHEIVTHEMIRDKIFYYINIFLSDYKKGFHFPSSEFTFDKRTPK